MQKKCLQKLETLFYYSYRLIPSTRSVHWGVPWGVVEDSMLLVGMLTCGVGNWDAIKNDPRLGLSSKVGHHYFIIIKIDFRSFFHK